ncbi:hypothetical protein BJX63DRAFT_28449 [Aspergillus granulosus]|uniref:Uncharacterized protein n=1 Tax=Aspergillus granulosus TaxID=176169 RepID=A0ABR4HUH2_9EURO
MYTVRGQCVRYGFTYDNHTSLWNVLDYYVTTISETQVTLADDVKLEYKCWNEATVWKDYKPESLVGAPILYSLSATG